MHVLVMVWGEKHIFWPRKEEPSVGECNNLYSFIPPAKEEENETRPGSALLCVSFEKAPISALWTLNMKFIQISFLHPARRLCSPHDETLREARTRINTGFTRLDQHQMAFESES
jgi:hypothetical protein